MAKISSSGYRFPPPHNGLNVNFCKDPKCANFGVAETPIRPYRAKGTEPQVGDYISVSIGKNEPRMKCSLCGDVLPIRNNASIHEELDRLSVYLNPTPEPSCPTPNCIMHAIPLTEGGKSYVAFGTTAAGTTRWRCKICGKTFTSGGKPTRKHKAPHKNRDVLMLLMNKVPLSRIEEITGLDCKSLYGKIDFIHRQFMLLAQNREQILMKRPSLHKMYVAVDRQMLIVNWSSRKERRNVQLSAIGTADLSSGYVFGMHLNFDGNMDPEQLEQDAANAGDYATSEPYRKFARFWLKPDYAVALTKDRLMQRDAGSVPSSLPGVRIG